MDWFSWKKWKKSKRVVATELKPLDTKLEHLERENEKLKRTVESLLSKFGSSAQVGKETFEDLSDKDLSELKGLHVTQKDLENIKSGKVSASQSTQSSGVSTDPSKTESSKIEPSSKTDICVKLISEGELSLEHIAKAETSTKESEVKSTEPIIESNYKNAIFVKSPQKDEVAVVEMRQVEWWTIINPDALEEQKDISYEDSELGDSFAVIQQDDVNESMANFLAVSIERHPDAKQLSPAELKQVLDSTLAQAKGQGKLCQAYGWGMWLYSSYSWGSYVVRIYREPVIVKLVLRAACILYNQPLLIPVFAKGLWSAASWALIACL